MATISWLNPVSGQWVTAADWSGTIVPGSGDDAVIAATGAGYTVSLTTSITVGAITIGTGNSELAIANSGGADAVSGNLSNAGDLDIDISGGQGGSRLTVGGTLTNTNYVQIGNNGLSANSTLSAAAVSNTGQIQLYGSGASISLLVTAQVADC